MWGLQIVKKNCNQVFLAWLLGFMKINVYAVDCDTLLLITISLIVQSTCVTIMESNSSQSQEKSKKKKHTDLKMYVLI